MTEEERNEFNWLFQKAQYVVEGTILVGRPEAIQELRELLDNFTKKQLAFIKAETIGRNN